MCSSSFTTGRKFSSDVRKSQARLKCVHDTFSGFVCSALIGLRLITPLRPVLWLLIHDKADATRPIALPRWRPRCCRVRHHGRQFEVGSSTGTHGHRVLSPLGQIACLSTSTRQLRGLCSQPRPWTHIQSRLMDFPLLKLLLTRPVLARADRTHHDKGGLNY